MYFCWDQNAEELNHISSIVSETQSMEWLTLKDNNYNCLLQIGQDLWNTQIEHKTGPFEKAIHRRMIMCNEQDEDQYSWHERNRNGRLYYKDKIEM